MKGFIEASTQSEIKRALYTKTYYANSNTIWTATRDAAQFPTRDAIIHATQFATQFATRDATLDATWNAQWDAVGYFKAYEKFH